MSGQDIAMSYETTKNFLSPVGAKAVETGHRPVVFTLPKTMTPADIVEEVKKSSSKWIKTKGPEYSNFYWQYGYGAFSVSSSLVDVVKNYIKNQKKHHEKVTFIDEYKQLLEEYGIPYEEKYL